MPKSTLYTPREAARALGISYPTLKLWIYKRKVRTIKTAGAITAFRNPKLIECLYHSVE